MSRKRKRSGHPADKRAKPRAKAAPVKRRDDFADFVRSQLREQKTGGAKANTIAAIKLSLCDQRNKQAEGKMSGPICICGAVANADGTMRCLGIPPDQWFEDLLDGTLRRGDAAPVG